MSNLVAWVQTALERKRYTVDYKRWLDEGETLTDSQYLISPDSDPALIAEAAVADDPATQITFFIRGGVVGVYYTLRLIITTSDGQVKEDRVEILVN